MKNKIVAGLGAASVALFGLVAMAHAQLSTSTLGTSVDSINGTFYDYFQVLLAKYWPFVVGAGLLLGVWAFGRRIIHSFL